MLSRTTGGGNRWGPTGYPSGLRTVRAGKAIFGNWRSRQILASPLKLAPPVRPSLKRRNLLHRPILHKSRPVPEVSTATSTSVDSPENQAQTCLQKPRPERDRPQLTRGSSPKSLSSGQRVWIGRGSEVKTAHSNSDGSAMAHIVNQNRTFPRVGRSTSRGSDSGTNRIFREQPGLDFSHARTNLLKSAFPHFRSKPADTSISGVSHERTFHQRRRRCASMAPSSHDDSSLTRHSQVTVQKPQASRA